MKVAAVQFKPKLGDILYNKDQILQKYHALDADIVLFPELALVGYCPKDDILKSKFIALSQAVLEEIIAITSEKILILPTLYYQNQNNCLYNAAVIAQNGKILAKSLKRSLPNYSIFDEKRYFFEGPTESEMGIFEYKKIKFGVLICEDIWRPDYCLYLKSKSVQYFLVPNASPFDVKKIALRAKIVKERFLETEIPIVYCNQVLCQDGILYDGTSFFFNGNNTWYAKSFQEDMLEVNLASNCANGSSTCDDSNLMLYNGLIFGMREYVTNSGFSKVLLGLSGGADSALVLTLAIDAFGKNNVSCIMMPSKFTSKESLEDAIAIASNVDVKLLTFEIQSIIDSFIEKLNLNGLAAENIQARIRGNILMAKSNQTNAMLLTTGNKSEIAVGYCTIYGDMCGGYNPIKDLYKTQVFDLMKWRNASNFNPKHPIPNRIIAKAPSAELKENQKDSDSLPEYNILDKILQYLIEENMTPDEVVEKGFNPKIVNKVDKLIKASEYKRSQGAPGTKISTRSFERSEWRYNLIRP